MYKINSPFVLWFTGMSGAGKTTLTTVCTSVLCHDVEILDGDLLRAMLPQKLGFSVEDRTLHMLRVGALALDFFRQGKIVLVALISPLKEIRDEIRLNFPKGQFLEVYCQCDFKVLVDRDTKGLYAKALAGEIKNFTGIDSPYEPPDFPEILVHTAYQTIEESTDIIFRELEICSLVTKKGC